MKLAGCGKTKHINRITYKCLDSTTDKAKRKKLQGRLKIWPAKEFITNSTGPDIPSRGQRPAAFTVTCIVYAPREVLSDPSQNTVCFTLQNNDFTLL
jgi:hypothetical protein